MIVFMSFYEQLTNQFWCYQVSIIVSEVIGPQMETGDWATVENSPDLCMEIDHQNYGNWVQKFLWKLGNRNWVAFCRANYGNWTIFGTISIMATSTTVSTL